MLNEEPAPTSPIPDWIPAAVDPAAMPLVVNPAAEIATDEAAFVAIVMPLPISPRYAAYLTVSDPLCYSGLLSEVFSSYVGSYLMAWTA